MRNQSNKYFALVNAKKPGCEYDKKINHLLVNFKNKEHYRIIACDDIRENFSAQIFSLFLGPLPDEVALLYTFKMLKKYYIVAHENYILM